MAKTIKPRLDFRTPTALELDRGDYPLGRIPHSAVREAHNDLAPVKFNEYERVLIDMADAIGDYGVSDTIPGCSDNVGAGLRKLYYIKFDKVGGTIEGPTVFNSAALVTFGADVTFNENLTQSGTTTDTDTDITTTGRLSARSVEVDWATGTTYRVGDIVVYDKKIYRCYTQHTSTVFIDDYAANWELAGGGGSTTLDVNVAPSTHTFSVGDIVRYDSGASAIGYLLAQADDPLTLGIAMVISAPDNQNFTIINQGYTDKLGTITDDLGAALTSDTWYFLSETVAGGITSTEPPISQPILYTLEINGGTGKVEEGFIFIGPKHNAGATVHVDSFTATAGQTQVELTWQPITKDYTWASINGVLQHETAYNLSGKTITFTSPLSAGQDVRVQYVHNLDAIPGASIVEVLKTLAAPQQVFDLSVDLVQEPIGKPYMNVSIDGQVQDESAYDLAGYVVTFAAVIPALSRVRFQVIYNMNILSPGAGTVLDSTFGAVEMYRGSPNILTDKIIPTGRNMMSIGPVTIDNGITVELQGTSVWVII